MNCVDCFRLAAELGFREREFVMARECLASVAEVDEPGLFRKLRSKLSDARIGRELARLQLESHRQIHTATD